jgi:hypothetical protein
MKTEAAIGFTWALELVHRDGRVEREEVHNLIPTEGLNHMMSTVFKGGTQVPTWYIALYEGNYTPQPGLTAASFPADATECTGYNGARPQFVAGAVSSGAVDNSSARAEFTFTEDKTVYGGVITSSSTKGSVNGVLTSAVRFSSPKVCEAGAILRVVASNSLTSAA